ncbi:S8 family serine peptidase, partial [bacterium]|nr:S8 family serine peptidase [bacterium]
FVILANAGIQSFQEPLDSCRSLPSRMRGRNDVKGDFFKSFILVFFCGLLFLSANLFADKLTKIDPMFRVYQRKAVAADISLIKAPLSLSVSKEVLIEAFVKFTDKGVVTDFIRANGGVVQAEMGDIMTIKIPLSLVDSLAALNEVLYVEAPKELTRKLDQALPAGNVDDVQAGTGLSQKYDGTNVIVGVADTGLDYTHDMFKDSDGNSRVLYYWDQTITGGGGVSEIDDSTGLECSAAEINDDSCLATLDTNGHGTHVTGIAAGKDSSYTGVAPYADIIFVKYGTTDADSSGSFSTSFVNACSYIFQKAASLSKAAVINLSVGTSLGAHDNTSLFEQGLNNLLSGQQGRVITNAAGNENLPLNDVNVEVLGGIHAEMTVESGTRKFNEVYILPIEDSDGDGVLDQSVGEGTVDIWMSNGSTCTIEVDVFRFATESKVYDWSEESNKKAAVAKEGTDTMSCGNEFTILIDYQTDSLNSQNNKHHAQINIEEKSGATTDLSDYIFHVIYDGDCTVESWTYLDYTAYLDFTKTEPLATQDDATFVSGDSNKTITIPGTASGVITVASFMSRKNWTDINGTAHDDTDTDTDSAASGGTFHDISYFSSLGPTLDEATTGNKPDIAAPGEVVVSALSSYSSATSAIKPDSTHMVLEGTSMSSPYVAGVAALILNKNPCLTAVEVKAAITGSAAKDTYTGSDLPNHEWGHGKIDALAAISSVSAAGESCALSSGGGTTTDDSSSSSGCSLLKEAPVSMLQLLVILIALPLIIYVRRSKRSKR